MMLFIGNNKYIVHFNGPFQAVFETHRVHALVLHQVSSCVIQGLKAERRLNSSMWLIGLLLLLQAIWFLVAHSMVPYFFIILAYCAASAIWSGHRISNAEKKLKKIAADNNVLIVDKETPLAQVIAV